MKLKYGINLEGGKISCGELDNLPIFLLSLDLDHLNEGLNQFRNDSTSSNYENNLFEYFTRSLLLQIQELKLNPKEYEELPVAMRTRIESFESFLKDKKI